jgi:RNase P/RNase MRP subunit POP5
MQEAGADANKRTNKKQEARGKSRCKRQEAKRQEAANNETKQGALRCYKTAMRLLCNALPLIQIYLRRHVCDQDEPPLVI